MGSVPHVVEDCLGILQLYSDGSISRTSDDQIDFDNFPIKDDGSVVWKDILYDGKHSLSLRLYKPKYCANNKLLPIIYFFHGGGFCVGSRTWPNCHNCCLRLSSELQALVIAPDYRLAPEYRLPAAMDDALASIKWLQNQTLSEGTTLDSWIKDKSINYERVYVIGDSSGGNMAHHLALRLGVGSPELAPVRVRGYVLMAPFFGGSLRTKSEEEGPDEPFLNMEILDRFWRLSLPTGATADHPLANPFGPLSPKLEPMKLDPLLVIVGGNELLKDRVEDYARKLKDLNKDVAYFEIEGMHHGFFTNDPFSQIANLVLQEIKYFMCRTSC
ncbi:carboxylesterase 15 [Lycium barbarum]|uniref:carboxylesterase 15 n=1 Tax=Lycium barbarum TaxID=112863 RepID=UPI0028160163|nr:probable carboxylesterase 15 [Lycium ferocissimum]XP_060168960.1 carboxylesterase 15 [Lycium barbarum]